MAYALITSIVVAGMWIASLHIRCWTRFEELCCQVARARDEMAELAQPGESAHEGMNEYRRRLFDELIKPSGQLSIPECLHDEALSVTKGLVFARRALIAYLLMLAPLVLQLAAIRK